MSDYQPTAAPWRPESCGWGGEASFEPGFMEGTGDRQGGLARWVVGALERGRFGGVKMSGKPRFEISGVRCTSCGHLELFAHAMPK